MIALQLSFALQSLIQHSIFISPEPLNQRVLHPHATFECELLLTILLQSSRAILVICCSLKRLPGPVGSQFEKLGGRFEQKLFQKN